MNYNKPPLSPQQHLNQLKQRGLLIDDEERVLQYLNHIGYYRLSAYFIPFENLDTPTIEHEFKESTHFDDVLNLYIFDRKLRLLIMEAIERIEVAVRTQWADKLSVNNNDAHAFMLSEHFKDPWKHQKNLSKIANELKDSKETFVLHYREKYKQPFLPPIWAVVETMSFGALSHWFSNTKDNQLKGAIAKNLGIPTVEIMESVLHCLTLIRNTAAHHSRMWNRKYPMQLPYIKKLSHLLEVEQQQPSKLIFNYLVVMGHLMKHIQPTTTWMQRIAEHIITLKPWQQQAMGFKADWHKNSFWSYGKAV